MTKAPSNESKLTYACLAYSAKHFEVVFERETRERYDVRLFVACGSCNGVVCEVVVDALVGQSCRERDEKSASQQTVDVRDASHDDRDKGGKHTF